MFKIGEIVEIISVSGDVGYRFQLGEKVRIKQNCISDAWITIEPITTNRFGRTFTWNIEKYKIKKINLEGQSKYYHIEQKIKEIKQRRESLGYIW